jgi:amino acid permease
MSNEIDDANEKKDNFLTLLARGEKGFKESLGIQHEDGPQDALGNKNANQQNEESSYPNRPLTSRIFGKMEEGSLRGSIFAVSSLALGTGCLSLPIRFTQISLAGGLFFLTISAGIAYWTLTLMIKSAQNSSTRDYSRLVRESLGKFPAVLLDGTILLYIFGVLISYQVIIYSIAGRVFFELSGKSGTFDEFNNTTWNTNLYKFPIMFTVCVILSPLCMLKDISRMRFASLFSVSSLLYVILIIIVESPSYYKHYLNNIRTEDPSTHENWYDITKAFGNDLLFFPSLATMFFSFTCHVGAFPVYKTLKDSIKVRRVYKVFKRSIILDLVLYYLVGITGFLTSPVNAPSLIIYREPKGGFDLAMTIAKLAICTNLMLSTPANYNAFRISFCELVMGIETQKLSDKSNFVLTVLTLFITATIGALYNDIIAYITLLGGIGSVIITFLMPGLLYVKNNGKGVTHWQNILIILFILMLCTFGFTGAVQTLLVK